MAFEYPDNGPEKTFAQRATRLVLAGTPASVVMMSDQSQPSITVGGNDETLSENLTKGPRKIAGGALIALGIGTAALWVYNHLNIHIGETKKKGEATTEITSISPVIARTPFFKHTQGGVGHAEESKLTQVIPSWGNVVGSYVLDWTVDTTGISVENATDASGQPTILVTRRNKDGQRIGFDMSTVQVTARTPQYCDLNENYTRVDPDCGGNPDNWWYSGWYGFSADPGKPEHELVGQYAEMTTDAMALDTECFNRNFLEPNKIDAADLFTAAVDEMLSDAVEGHPIPPEAIVVEIAKGKRNFIQTQSYTTNFGRLAGKYDLIKQTEYVDGTPVDNNHCLSGINTDEVNRTLSSVALLTKELQPGTIITDIDPVTSRVTVITAPQRVAEMRQSLPRFSNNGSQRI